MENQLKNDFEKTVKTSGFSKKDIDMRILVLTLIQRLFLQL